MHCNLSYEASAFYLVPLPSLFTKPISSFLQHRALQLCNIEKKTKGGEGIRESSLEVFGLVIGQEKDHKMSLYFATNCLNVFCQK